MRVALVAGLLALAARRPNVTILMADTRSVFVERGAVGPRTFVQDVAAINAAYARRHAYSFAWVQLPCVRGSANSTCVSCLHHGAERHASWCKLLVAWHALVELRAERVVWMDSDAYFKDAAQPIDYLFAGAQPGVVLTVYWNDPFIRYGLPVCAGVLALRNAPAARALVADWWNDLDFGGYHMRHDYEQRVLSARLLARAPRAIGVLRRSALLGGDPFVEHVASFRRPPPPPPARGSAASPRARCAPAGAAAAPSLRADHFAPARRVRVASRPAAAGGRRIELAAEGPTALLYLRAPSAAAVGKAEAAEAAAHARRGAPEVLAVANWPRP